MPALSDHGWADFTRWLDSLLIAHKPSANVWLWPWTRKRDSQQLEADYSALENDFVAEFQAAIEELLRSDRLPWETMSAQAAALLRVRLEVVACFSHQCVVSSPAHQMIPFPELTYPEFLSWFLSEWWGDHGVEEACQMWMAQQWEQPSEENPHGR